MKEAPTEQIYTYPSELYMYIIVTVATISPMGHNNQSVTTVPL